MGYNLITKHGHNMFDMSSMMQKAIRRSNPNLAGYAAYELFGNFHTYLWKRLIVVSAEDCYGIITKEIIALKIADDTVNKGKKGYEKDPLFVAKAITLLCLARKNRDACYVACNFMLPDRTLDANEIEHVDITQCRLGVEGIPDWVFDVHTLTGKKNGKTDLDMTISEQAALEPKQISMFDDCSWANYYNWARAEGNVGDKEWKDFQRFKEGRKLEPDYDKEENSMNDDMRAGAALAIQGVKEEIDTILRELHKKGIETPKGFGTLQGYVEDRMRELCIEDSK